MKNEADVKTRVKEILNEMGAWWFMYVPVGYGKSGIPDFLACYKGQFLSIEAKYGKRKVTPLQNVQMREIEKAEGIAIVVDEYNVQQLKEIILRKCS